MILTVIALGLLLGFAMQAMFISGLTYLVGGPLVFDDPGNTLIAEFLIALLAAAVAILAALRIAIQRITGGPK